MCIVCLLCSFLVSLSILTTFIRGRSGVYVVTGKPEVFGNVNFLLDAWEIDGVEHFVTVYSQ